jgi:hypothetical protein
MAQGNQSTDKSTKKIASERTESNCTFENTAGARPICSLGLVGAHGNLEDFFSLMYLNAQISGEAGRGGGGERGEGGVAGGEEVGAVGGGDGEVGDLHRRDWAPNLGG